MNDIHPIFVMLQSHIALNPDKCGHQENILHWMLLQRPPASVHDHLMAELQRHRIENPYGVSVKESDYMLIAELALVLVLRDHGILDQFPKWRSGLGLFMSRFT